MVVEGSRLAACGRRRRGLVLGGLLVVVLVAAANLGGLGSGAPAADAASCYVRSGDHRLHCGHSLRATMYADPSFTAPVINHLHPGSSFFRCWTTGDPHDGGNRIWYGAVGDVTRGYGFVPAGSVYTSGEFDANPSAYGLPHC